ncbi:hypothetical protein P8C59_003520 [Phyllachora maydis]|uniref:FAD dependent oxidoreductase domain-containing protein n=1 Tax=Phyllachora maydis TaxID=1825666 RepID=A0AAD9I1K9_9PEZI|nr:hypothetical protein P8C59_003520 [Phyllachora maydis]
MPPLAPTDRIAIVGAGAFGLSTALHLVLAGHPSALITVLDRSLPPVTDGSSVDISRIIRADYADPVYATLGAEALAAWQAPGSVFAPAFHAAPFCLVVQETAHGRTVADPAYLAEIKHNLRRLGLPYRELASAEDVRRAWPEGLGAGRLAGRGFQAYVSEDAGWADAAMGVTLARDECVRRGVSFIGGEAGTVRRLLYRADGTVMAAETASGLVVEADVFVVAAGAWTAGLVSLGQATISTGQIVAFLKLRGKEEEQRFSKLPIYINLSTGWFVFPTHPDTKLLKIACHGFGYTNTMLVVDADGPRDISTPPVQKMPTRLQGIPEEGISRLRAGLVDALGVEFADRPLERTAVCWYTETPTGDFIIDRHPRHSNLVVATGGSGHGYKMIPIIGKYIVQAMQGTLSEQLRSRWRLDTKRMAGDALFSGDGSRGGPPRREFTPLEKAKL